MYTHTHTHTRTQTHTHTSNSKQFELEPAAPAAGSTVQGHLEFENTHCPGSIHLASKYEPTLVVGRCQANIAHIRQSMPDSGNGCEAKVLHIG